MTGGRKRMYPKISIEPGVENVYTQKFMYENYIYITTERKVRRVGRPFPPLLYFPLHVRHILINMLCCVGLGCLVCLVK
ncbi:hypothetical protein Hanom_Chr14g01285041 [Helianthus anomalus]